VPGRTAIIFGGTGLIGKALTEELGKSCQYEKIIAFTRRKTEFDTVLKVNNQVVDFENPESFSGQIIGDDIFICLGTTIKKAGSVKKMEKIDRDLPVILAKYAHKNSVSRLAIVSSIGANVNSSNYYLRIKGEMEREIMNINFETVAIARPSLLLGRRDENRFGESAGKLFMKVLSHLLYGRLRKYRAIEGRIVAKALIGILRSETGKNIYESDQLQKLAYRK